MLTRTVIHQLRKSLGGAKFEIKVEMVPSVYVADTVAAVRMVLSADYRIQGRSIPPAMPSDAPRALQAMGHLIAAELLVRLDEHRRYCAPQVQERETWARGTITVVKMEIADEGDEAALRAMFEAVAAEVSR